MGKRIAQNRKDFFKSLIFVRAVSRLAILLFLIHLISIVNFAQNKYENRKILDVNITFEGADRDISAAEQFKLIAQNSLGATYSTVKVRDAIDDLYKSDKIVSAQVEASTVGADGVNLRFIIKRKTQAEKVYFNIGTTIGKSVTEEELRLKLNILNPGTAITQQILDNNATAIQVYLRERGFYNATVTASQAPLESETRVAVTFNVTPNAEAKVENFAINIDKFDATKIRKELKLQPGAYYSRDVLLADVEKIKKAILKENFLAPQISEPNVVINDERNTISIELNGKVGPKVNVKIDAEKEKVSDKTQETLLPIKREGTIEQSAIIEGARRLRNYFQEKGYFFAETNTTCSVNPPLTKDETNPDVTNGSALLCESLTGADLEGKTVDVNYNVVLNRRLKLQDIRIEGTDKITVLDILSVIDTQRASLIGIIPRLGYGRGYTSLEILEDDRARVQSLMRELGYRQATATVKQGVSPAGEDLIITFVINEGIPTKVDTVDIVGNNVIAKDVLQKELPNLIGRNYSRANARNGVQKLSTLYAQEGYYDAKVSYAIVELPNAPNDTEDKVKVVYNIDREGKKVFINRVLINGNEMTERDTILKAINLRPNEVLRATDIFTSEQNLYATDAFRRVEIKAEPAGTTPNGDAQRDIIINLEEQPPRIITYGGGFSTDEGALGFFDIRHINLFGKLQQGGARVRLSRRQQLVQFDFLNPRFFRDGKNSFAPLSITAQYQRDSTVTRFFRSTFDSGTGGIVQRLDADGNPIDVFGNTATDPTINRFTLTAETQRTIRKKDRSLIFVRYKFEDVRIFNTDSLLIANLLQPDDRVRVSGFGVSFVRDTRENCNRKYSVLELISKGEYGDPCRYNPSDPTRGSYLTVDYNVSARQLGGNISFQKFQANYQTYYQLPKFTERLDRTIIAGRLILGLGTVFSRAQTFTGTLEPLNGSLPISERFFAGGSTTLRGFDFESAGPRVAVVPQGTFRNSSGDIVTLNPFTVPFGGNGLVITNLEARVPLTESIQAVPFYDGGNVFNRVSDIFKPLQPETGDVFKDNLRATWKHTFGLGLRIKTPVGGAFAIDYGFLLNPPRFFVPQNDGSNAIFQLKRGQLHFRFSQSF